MTLATEIAALQEMPTAQLAAEYMRLVGRAPRYRQPAWLRKRIAFHLQTAAFGGLSAPARAELDRLAADLRLPDHAPLRAGNDDHRGVPGKPKPGTVLQREWRGQMIRVHVTAAGFEWDGREFGSLSAVAKVITGQHWNGRLFFGLAGRAKRK